LDVQAENSVFQKGQLESVKTNLIQYYKFAKKTSLRMIQGETGDQMVGSFESMSSQYNSIKENLKSIINQNKNKMNTNFDVVQNNNRMIAVVATIGIIIGITLISALSYFILKAITRPLQIAADTAEKVGQGDLTINIPQPDVQDEIGILIIAFGKMVENLRNLTVQIKEVANALATASSEISSSVSQIASGATETATAANETGTTVEEVRQTAQDSNLKAKQVSENAQKAVQTSQAGEKSVSDTIEGMHRIEAQMESIAESIMKLSEHGQAIGGIIMTVEDVAEQSNLLAVNASIEATKAGEHGKGFAVVAHEVKSLAEQSRQATARVRSILDDIQKATSGAVMTTEQGSKAVEAGVKQSTDAGEAIRRLASSVAEAAQSTTQISVSSQEQLVGMDQIVSAMESIKQASTQNVSATKQVESAARDLHEFGQKIKILIEQYKV
jgi:methyl-accepting chemotaxis protein